MITKNDTHFYLKRNTAIDWMVITCISKLQNLFKPRVEFAESISSRPARSLTSVTSDPGDHDPSSEFQCQAGLRRRWVMIAFFVSSPNRLFYLRRVTLGRCLVNCFER